MKARRVTLLRVFVGLLCLATASPIAGFLWIFISFEIELSTREKEARRMTPEAATQLIEDAKRFAALHAKDDEYFNIGKLELQQIHLPESIKKLEPRRIVGQKDHIAISLIHRVIISVTSYLRFRKSHRRFESEKKLRVSDCGHKWQDRSIQVQKEPGCWKDSSASVTPHSAFIPNKAAPHCPPQSWQGATALEA